MSFLKDALSIFKKSELTLISKVKESDDVYTFLFEKGDHINWQAGQHGLFTIIHKKIKNGIRPFTIASSPTENEIKITTRIGANPSEFKKALLALEEGSKIRMSGPVGSFYLKDDRPTLFIAGGIGVTPFRAMIKQMETDGSHASRQVKLLYLDSENTHLYKEELDEIVKHSSIEIDYLDDREELYRRMDEFISLHANDRSYYIAGAKAMVNSINNYLKGKDISKRNIKNDSFMGIE